EALLDSATAEQRLAIEALLVQLEDIDTETEIAAEEYNAAKLRLDQINVSIATNESDYDLISKAFVLQADKLGQRAVDYYRDGTHPALTILLESKSFTDFYSRLRYVTQLSSLDAELLSKIRSQKARLENTLQQLRADHDQAASLEFELKARKIEVTQRNEDRQTQLREQNRDLLAFLEADRTAGTERERQLALSINTGKLKDVVIEPGSPAETALTYRGIPYKWGGATKSGFDCSGLVLYTFAQHGVKLPHHSASQALQGEKVAGTLQANDVVFFGSPIHHVGIYIGGGYYVHAPRTGDVVKISKLSDRRDLSAARRYNWDVRSKAPR
ncbi:MAG: C40 family peptidase, partial [Actinomycetes bacterium]|nr:C40 family peptidase [Actinomycetes bacterium]